MVFILTASNLIQFADDRKEVVTSCLEIQLKVVEHGSIDGVFRDNFKPEVAGDAISGETKEEFGRDVSNFRPDRS